MLRNQCGNQTGNSVGISVRTLSLFGLTDGDRNDPTLFSRESKQLCRKKLSFSAAAVLLLPQFHGLYHFLGFRDSLRVWPLIFCSYNVYPSGSIQCELRFVAQRAWSSVLLIARGVHSFSPERETICGLPVVLSVTERVPDPEPFCSSHVTDIVQNRPGCRFVPQLFPSENGPVIVIPLIFKV